MLIPTAAQLLSTLAWFFAAMQASINSQYATLLPAIEGVTSTVSSLVAMPLSPFKISTVKTLLAHPTNRSSWSFPSISSKVRVDISDGLLSVKFSFPIVSSPFVPVSNATQLDATKLVDATNSSLDGVRPFETSAEVISSDALFWSLAQDTCAQGDVIDIATSNADKGALSTAFTNGKANVADILFVSSLEPTRTQCDVDEVLPKDLESPELGISGHKHKTTPEPEEASAREMPPKVTGSSTTNTNESSGSDLCPGVESCEIVVWTPPPEPSPSDYATAINQAWYNFWTLVEGLLPILFTVIGVVFLLEAYHIGAVSLRWLSSVLYDAAFALTIAGLQFIQNVGRSDQGIVDVFDVNDEYELEEEVEDVPIIVEEDIQITVAPIPRRRLIPTISFEDMHVDGDDEDDGDDNINIEGEDCLPVASAPAVEGGPEIDVDAAPTPCKRVRRRKQKASQPTSSQLDKYSHNKKGGKRKAKAKCLVESVPLLCDGEAVLPLVDTDDEAACNAIPELPVTATDPTAVISTRRLSNKGKCKKHTGRKRNVIIPNAATSAVSHAGSTRMKSCPSLEVAMAGLQSNTFAYTQTNTGGRERMERMSRAVAWAPSTSMDANESKMEWDEEGWEEVKRRKHRNQKRNVIEDDEYGVEEDEFEEERFGFEDDYDDAFGTSLPASF